MYPSLILCPKAIYIRVYKYSYQDLIESWPTYVLVIIIVRLNCICTILSEYEGIYCKYAMRT